MKSLAVFLHRGKQQKDRDRIIDIVKKVINNSIPEMKYQKYLARKFGDFIDSNYHELSDCTSYLMQNSNLCNKVISWLWLSLDDFSAKDEYLAEEVFSDWLCSEVVNKVTDDTAAFIEYFKKISDQEGFPMLDICRENRMFFRYIMENFCELNFANDRKTEQLGKIVSIKEYREVRKCRM